MHAYRGKRLQCDAFGLTSLNDMQQQSSSWDPQHAGDIQEL